MARILYPSTKYMFVEKSAFLHTPQKIVYNNGVLHLVSVLVCFSKIHFSKLVSDGHLKEKLVKKGRVDPLLFPRWVDKSSSWVPTWRIIPVSKWLVTPIYKPFRPFGKGITPFRGLTNHGY